MFNDELKTQVEEVINKNLPALAAKEVVERLQRIDNLEKLNYEFASKQLTDKKQIEDLSTKLNEYLNIESREKTLITSEQKLKDDQKEFEFQKQILQLKLDHATQQKTDIYQLSSIFFASPVKMTTIHKTTSDNEYNSGSNKNNMGTENTNITER